MAVAVCIICSQVKHLQFLSGIHASSYWLANYVYDLLNTLVPIILTIIIFAAFRAVAFSSPRALGAIFILLVKIAIVCLMNLLLVCYSAHQCER